MTFDELSLEEKKKIELMVSKEWSNLECRKEIKRMTHENFPNGRDLVEHFERRWHRARLYKYYEKVEKSFGSIP
jgi:hypothetical protein